MFFLVVNRLFDNGWNRWLLPPPTVIFFYTLVVWSQSECVNPNIKPWAGGVFTRQKGVFGQDLHGFRSKDGGLTNTSGVIKLVLQPPKNRVLLVKNMLENCLSVTLW